MINEESVQSGGFFFYFIYLFLAKAFPFFKHLEADGPLFCVFSTDSEGCVTAGNTETQSSGDYYGDSKYISIYDGLMVILMLFVIV